jgi:hypothetical protein
MATSSTKLRQDSATSIIKTDDYLITVIVAAAKSASATKSAAIKTTQLEPTDYNSTNCPKISCYYLCHPLPNSGYQLFQSYSHCLGPYYYLDWIPTSFS